MAGKREKPEDIVTKLRQVEVLHGQGLSMADAVVVVSTTRYDGAEAAQQCDVLLLPAARPCARSPLSLLFAVSLVLGLRVLQWGVRGTLAACIHDIARIIGRELTEKHLKDIYRRLMDDWFQVCNRGSSRKGESQ